MTAAGGRRRSGGSGLPEKRGGTLPWEGFGSLLPGYFARHPFWQGGVDFAMENLSPGAKIEPAFGLKCPENRKNHLSRHRNSPDP